MSETIIRIMTSSSTRNTEPRGGRVAFMRSVLAHPSLKFRKNYGPVQRLHHISQRLCKRRVHKPRVDASQRPANGLIAPRTNVKLSRSVPNGERGLPRNCC